MTKHVFAAVMVLFFLSACSEKGGNGITSPSNTTTVNVPPPTNTNTGPNYDVICVQKVGSRPTAGGYLLFYGNLNSCETSIADWNGWQFNVFVTNGTNVHKYIVDVYNSVIQLPVGVLRATVIQNLVWGSSVKFEVRLLFQGNLPYTQMKYGRKGDPNAFQLLPTGYSIGADYFTTGPLPTMDPASAPYKTLGFRTSGEYEAAVNAAVASAPKPLTCEFDPRTATDCEAR